MEFYGDSVIHRDLANNKLDIYEKYMEIASGKLRVCYWKWPFSSLIHPLNMVIFHSYVSSPEGTSSIFMGHFPKLCEIASKSAYKKLGERRVDGR